MKKKNNGDILRWAKANMEYTEYQKLVSAKDTNPQAFINAVENLKTLKAQMEGKPQQSKPKTKQTNQAKKAKAGTKKNNTQSNSVVNSNLQERLNQRKSEILSEIAFKRREHREYNKEIVPLEAALSSENRKIEVMAMDIELASQKVLDMGNEKETMLEQAKYVCKVYPKALSDAKKLLDACSNNQKKKEIQQNYEAMMEELNEMRVLRSKLDGFFAKTFEGTKVVLKTLLFGSANRTVLQEIKLNAGGY